MKRVLSEEQVKNEEACRKLKASVVGGYCALADKICPGWCDYCGSKEEK